MNLFQQAEQGFDKLFSYNRQLSESFEYSNTMKNGSIDDKLRMQERELKEPKQYFTCENKKMYSNPVKKKTIFLATLIARQIKNILTTIKIAVVAILYYLSSHWERAIIMLHQ